MQIKPPTQEFCGSSLQQELVDAGASNPTVAAVLVGDEYELEIQADPLTEAQVQAVVLVHTGEPTLEQKADLAKAKRIVELRAKPAFSKVETDELLKLLLERL